MNIFATVKEADGKERLLAVRQSREEAQQVAMQQIIGMDVPEGEKLQLIANIQVRSLGQLHTAAGVLLRL